MQGRIDQDDEDKEHEHDSQREIAADEEGIGDDKVVVRGEGADEADEKGAEKEAAEGDAAG